MAIDLTARFVADGIISRDQLCEAETVAKRLRISVESVLLQLKYLDEHLLVKSKAEAYGLEFVDLETFAFPESSRLLIPERIAREYICIALGNVDELLKIAVIDPLNFDLIDKLHLALNRTLAPVIAKESQIRAAIDRIYGDIETVSSNNDMVSEFWNTDISFDDADMLDNQGDDSTNSAQR